MFRLKKNKMYKIKLISGGSNEHQDELNKVIDFDISMIGEGIVYTHMTPDGEAYRFKSKGEKHAKGSKIKTLKPVDDEKVNKVISIVNQITPEWRLEQMLEKTFDLINGGEIDIKKMGEFIKNVIADVIKEESDVLADNGLEPKDVNSKVSEVCRNYFFAKQNEAVGL